MALTYTKKPRTYRRTTKPRTTLAKKKYFKSRYPARPSRFRGGTKRQLMQTKYVTKALSQVAETFYNPMAAVVDSSINGSTNSADVKFKGLTVGQTVPSHLTGYTALNGMDFSTANGKYVYLKKGQALITIEMDSTANSDSLTYVRLIMYKNKRTAEPAGTIANPNTSLFLNNDGTFFGHSSTVFEDKLAMNSLLNKQNFIIYRDHKMILSNPRITPDGDRAYSGKYPVMKQFRFNMPFYIKTALKTDGTPSDVDYHWNIVAYVTTQNGAGTPTDCTMSLNNHLCTWTDI